MRYKAVIFDLDGVLCHTDEYHYLAWKQIADQLEIPFTRQINDKMRGLERMASLDVLLGQTGGMLSKEIKKNLADKKNAIYLSLLQQLSPADLEADVSDTLSRLRKSGVKLGIGSSSKNTRLILERLGLETFFDAVSDGTLATRAKPDPEIFLTAADMLDMEPKDCLVVEDAEAGLLAARAAGMDAAAVGNGIRSNLAAYHLKNISELLRIVERSSI